MRISLGYPAADEERRLMLVRAAPTQVLAGMEPVLSLEELRGAQAAVEEVVVAPRS